MKTKRETQKAKILSLLLAVAMAFASLPQIALPVSSVEAEPPRAVLISAEYEPGRGEYEKHFLLNDGSFIAVSYADAVHYEDCDGKWLEVDNRLAFDGNTSRIVSESGDFGTSFAASAGDGDLVSVSKDGKVISWSLSVSDGETEYTSAPYVSPEYSEKGKDKDFSGLDINDPETFELNKAYGLISYPSLFEELPEISANYTIA
ncbi:MAG: hypothetical protein IJU75_02330, partial [Clostridia bacterium]|nr:hypothetical protein [Clostridia bacterium]